ncbi:DNA-directed RNA polymerase RPB5 subunit [Entophlyctis helioformis]|nr:DNA-directed RNA polymerase RPB5 subunit [Entophlyctis helioformis]
MDEDREVSRLWRVYRTVHEMVHHRGYEVTRDELEMPLDVFRDTYFRNGSTVDRQGLTFLVQNSASRDDQLLVFFTDDETVGIKPIKKICERMMSQSIMKGILIYKKSLTPRPTRCDHACLRYCSCMRLGMLIQTRCCWLLRQVVQEMAPKYQLELFQESELLVNITAHTLVPVHEVLTNEEKKTLLARYRLKETQLPRITPSDPVARYYGLKRGQVVKIIRPSETAGKYVTYRFCF